MKKTKKRQKHEIPLGYVSIEFNNLEALKKANIAKIIRDFEDCIKDFCPRDLFGKIDDNVKKEIEKARHNNAYSPSNDIKKTVVNKRGRPRAKRFEEYLMPDAPPKLMDVLDELMKGKKGKEAARIIIAITGYYIYEPAARSVCQRFPSVKISAFNDARNKHYGRNNAILINGHHFNDEELENVRTTIKEKLTLYIM